MVGGQAKCNGWVRRLCGCFLWEATQLARMSLNRSEQRVFDYIQSHSEERQYWLTKVQNFARQHPDPHEAAQRLESDLWRYYQERSEVAWEFRDEGRLAPGQRVSLRNLAEYLLRLWVAPKPKKPREG